MNEPPRNRHLRRQQINQPPDKPASSLTSQLPTSELNQPEHPLQQWIDEHPLRIDLRSQAGHSSEVPVPLQQILMTQGVELAPVWPAFSFLEDGLQVPEVRPLILRVVAVHRDIAGFPSLGGGEWNIVSAGRTHFDREEHLLATGIDLSLIHI